MEKLRISDEIRAKLPELTDLIIGTDSMENEEKQYWFEIIPVMTQEQLEKFQKFLEAENMELLNLEKKYGKIATDEAKVALREKWIAYLTA